MESSFESLLKSSPLLFDGGMGTEIQKAGLKQGASPEIMNLIQPDVILNIHKHYLDAGASVIETNSFGANRMRLHAELKSRVPEVNRAAAEIALNAAGKDFFVAGSVGPTGAVLEPFGELSTTEAGDIFIEQIEALLNGGIKIILIETMMSLSEALAALSAAKKLNAPVTGVTMTFNVTGETVNTPFGEPVEYVCRELIENGADFIGSNCGNGFDNMIIIGREIKKYSSVPVLLQPNAGLPVIENNKLIYKESPELYAEFVKKATGLGVEFIGGCCGTTYAHIEAANRILKSLVL